MRRPLWLFALILLGLLVARDPGKLKAAFHFIESKIVKQPTTIVVVAILVGWILGYLVGRYRRQSRTYHLQNSGEALLSHAVTKRFAAPDWHLMNHLTLRVDDGTTQIDHVLVSRFGVFVIETKDYQGWIFADASHRYWTQVIYKLRFRFQNPVRQNYKHLCAVRELLEFLPPDAVRPVVVFTGRAVFKTGIPQGVFTLEGFLEHVSGHSTEVMSLNRVQFCVGRLETARQLISKATDVEHVKFLQRRFGIDE